MKIFMIAVVLALFNPTKEEELSRRYIRHRRDGTAKTSISTNDGIEENSKLLNAVNKIKENEINDQIADSTEKKEVKSLSVKNITTNNNQTKVKTGTVVTNIKNIVTHEDVDGHRSALSEALLHQFHGPNEKVLFLPDSEEEVLKHEHQLITPLDAHHAGQQIVINPESLYPVGEKLALYPQPIEEKVQKLIYPQPVDSKVVVLRKSQEDVLTNLHTIPQRLIFYPRADEHLLHSHAHGAATHKVEHVHHSHGEKPVLLLPKISDETVAAINQLHYNPPQTHEETHKMHYLPSVFASPDVVHKSYGGGYTLPVAPGTLSSLNVEHSGKVPVVVSNMAGFNTIGGNSLVNHLHKILQLQLSKSVLPQLVNHVKLAEQQVDKAHEIDLGSAIHHHFTIVKKVGIPYIKPVAYPVVQRVPIIIERPRLVKPYLPSVPVHLPISSQPSPYQIPISHYLSAHTHTHPHHHHHHHHQPQHIIPFINPLTINPYVKTTQEIPLKIPVGLTSYFSKTPTLVNFQKPIQTVQTVQSVPKSILIQKSEPVLVKHELAGKQ